MARPTKNQIEAMTEAWENDGFVPNTIKHRTRQSLLRRGYAEALTKVYSDRPVGSRMTLTRVGIEMLIDLKLF